MRNLYGVISCCVLLSLAVVLDNAYAKQLPKTAEVSAISLDVLRVKACAVGQGCSTVGGPKQWNLFDLAEGKTDFANQVLMPAKTHELRLMLGSKSTITVDGQTYSLTVPSGQVSGLKLKGNKVFASASGFLKSIRLNFDLAKGLIVTAKKVKGKGKKDKDTFVYSYSLKPVIQVSSAEVMPMPENMAAVVALPDKESRITLGDKFSLFIPAGAVTYPMVISVKETKYTVEVLDEATGEVVKKPALSSDYELQPDGAKFSVPLEIAIPYYPDTLPSEVSEYDLAVYLDGEKNSTSSIDTTSKITEADISHFTSANVSYPERQAFQTEMPIDFQSDNFGYRFMTYEKDDYYTYHPGVDLNALNDSNGNVAVRAIADGEIVANSSGWGGIVIKHSIGDKIYYSQYGHIYHLRDETELTIGDTVTRGQQIGYIGNTKSTGGFHLHFEIRSPFHTAPDNADYWETLCKDSSAICLKTRKDVFKGYESPFAFVRSYLNPDQPTIIIDDSVTYPGISTDINNNKVVVDGEIIKERFFKPDNLSEWNTYVAGAGENRAFGGNYHYAPTVVGNETSGGKWYFDIPESGKYKIYVSVPHGYATATKANYQVFHNNQLDYVVIDQDAVDGSLEERWTSLGVFDFKSGNNHYVRLGNNTGETGKHVAFDAIKLVQVSSAPDPESVINSISPSTATLDELTTFTVTGEYLPSTLAFWISECENVTSLSGSSTSMRFSCTPSYTTGEKNGVIKDAAGGAVLKEFTINVSGSGSPPEESFTCTSGSQTATWQGRVWQRCDDGKTYTWQEAKNYCDNLALGGYSDWRLPTNDELRSLVACTNGTPTPLAVYPDDPSVPYSCGSHNSAPYDRPTISSDFECKSEPYWSSSPYSKDTSYTLTVDFDYGWSSRENPATNYFYVRCVR